MPVEQLVCESAIVQLGIPAELSFFRTESIQLVPAPGATETVAEKFPTVQATGTMDLSRSDVEDGAVEAPSATAAGPT